MDVWESGEERLRMRRWGYRLGVVGRAGCLSPDDISHRISVLNAITRPQRPQGRRDKKDGRTRPRTRHVAPHGQGDGGEGDGGDREGDRMSGGVDGCMTVGRSGGNYDNYDICLFSESHGKKRHGRAICRRL